MSHGLEISDWATPAAQSIAPDASIADALRAMRAHNVHHLPVIHGGELVGIVSHKDVLMFEAIDGVDAERVKVRKAMVRTPYVVGRATALREVAQHLIEKRLDCAVVVEGGKVVGVFTPTDALRVLVDLLKP